MAKLVIFLEIIVIIYTFILKNHLLVFEIRRKMTNFAADLHISIYTRTSFLSISSPWNSWIRLSLIIGMYPILQDVA